MHVILVSYLRELDYSISPRPIVFLACLELDSVALYLEEDCPNLRLEEASTLNSNETLINCKIDREDNPHNAAMHDRDARHEAYLLYRVLTTVWGVNIAKLIRLKRSLLCNTAYLQVYKCLCDLERFGVKD